MIRSDFPALPCRRPLGVMGIEVRKRVRRVRAQPLSCYHALSSLHASSLAWHRGRRRCGGEGQDPVGRHGARGDLALALLDDLARLVRDVSVSAGH